MTSFENIEECENLENLEKSELIDLINKMAVEIYELEKQQGEN